MIGPTAMLWVIYGLINQKVNMKSILIAFLTALVVTGLTIYLSRPFFGTVGPSSITTTDTVSTLRKAVNDLITTANGFSTTTANTFTALQTFDANVTVTTSNSATSTVIAGCSQTYATSTLTPIKLAFTSSKVSTTTFGATANGGTVVWTFGSCP